MVAKQTQLPGLLAARVTMVPQKWDPEWFRNFITNHLVPGDIRNATVVGGLQIIQSPSLRTPPTLNISGPTSAAGALFTPDEYYEDGLMVPGPPGGTGTPGPPGPAGPALFFEMEQGEDPINLPGPAGAPGPQGIAGAQGTNAAIIPGEEIYPDDPLVVPGLAGPTGPQGPPGTGGNTTGTPIFIPDEYIEDLLIIPGDKGAIGATGAVGAIGPTFLPEDIWPEDALIVPGPLGLQGSTGPAGGIGPALFFEMEQGEDPINLPGPQGLAGPAGPVGAVGPPALPHEDIWPEDFLTVPGPLGLQGPAGPPGAMGPVLQAEDIAFFDSDVLPPPSSNPVQFLSQLTILGVAGVALTATGVAGQYAGFFQGSPVSGSSQGVAIAAGVSATDVSFVVVNAANTLDYLEVFGDGHFGLGYNGTGFSFASNTHGALFSNNQPGTSGQVLTSLGTLLPPVWTNPATLTGGAGAAYAPEYDSAIDDSDIVRLQQPPSRTNDTVTRSTNGKALAIHKGFNLP